MGLLSGSSSYLHSTVCNCNVYKLIKCLAVFRNSCVKFLYIYRRYAMYVSVDVHILKIEVMNNSVFGRLFPID